MPVTTLAEEKQFNTFFRLQNPAIIAGLRQHFPDLAGSAHAARGLRETARAAQPVVNA